MHALLLLLAAIAAGTFLAACGHPHRPASSLAEQDRALLAIYEQIRSALAQDNPIEAQKGALALIAELKKGNPTPGVVRVIALTQAVADARALDAQRELFKPLSNSLIPMVTGVDGYYIMTSPPGFTGDWIQLTPEVDNPYFGKVMHSSGSIRK